MSSTKVQRKILVALPPSMVLEVDHIAKAEHRTRSDLIRESLRRYIDGFKTRYAATIGNYPPNTFAETAAVPPQPVAPPTVTPPLPPNYTPVAPSVVGFTAPRREPVPEVPSPTEAPEEAEVEVAPTKPAESLYTRPELTTDWVRTTRIGD